MSKSLDIKYGPFGFTIQYRGGGQLPSSLKGHFTSRERAQEAIDAYKLLKPKKPAKNADSKD